MKEVGSSVRADQWLWAVRVTKTRSQAAELCRGGHVKVNGKTAKPATPVKVDDTVEAMVHRRRRIFVVRKLLVKRVGAALAGDHYEDLSPPPPEPEVDAIFAQRDRGTGRPTKRDRRDWEKYFKD